MGRPPSDNPRLGQVRIRCTDEEIELLDQCIADDSMGRAGGKEESRSSYIRALIADRAAAIQARNNRLHSTFNTDELDFFKRCAAHAACSLVQMTRHLYTAYAGDYGIPVRRDTPAPLTADQMFAKLGIVKSNVEHHTVDASSLEGNIDPDRFDESNTSTIEPLPPRRVP